MTVESLQIKDVESILCVYIALNRKWSADMSIHLQAKPATNRQDRGNRSRSGTRDGGSCSGSPVPSSAGLPVSQTQRVDPVQFRRPANSGRDLLLQVSLGQPTLGITEPFWIVDAP